MIWVGDVYMSLKTDSWAMASGYVQACPVASCCCCTEPGNRIYIPTVAGLLPADVPTLSRGESHHKLRKERPVSQYWRNFSDFLFMWTVLGAVFVTAGQSGKCASSFLVVSTGYFSILTVSQNVLLGFKLQRKVFFYSLKHFLNFYSWSKANFTISLAKSKRSGWMNTKLPELLCFSSLFFPS